MAKKKAKGKATEGKAGTKKPEATRDKTETETVDLVEARKSIALMVTGELKGITQAAVDDAKKGQLATLKYLFEITGVYPAFTDASDVQLEDDSLARTLMERLQIPFGPLPPREGDEERGFAAPAKVVEAEKELSSEEDSVKVEAAE